METTFKATNKSEEHKGPPRRAEGLRKPVIGVYGVTGCYGCMLSVIFNEDDLLDLIEAVDLKSFPFIKEHNPQNIHYDVILVEGLVAKKEDIEELKKWRGMCTYLVALGACAHTGGIPAMRNFIGEDRYAKLKFNRCLKLEDTQAAPIDNYVTVDYTIPGCPPDKKEILSFIKDFALGRVHRGYLNPVCVECRKNENRCLLEDGKLCLGPITSGGCNSVCTNAGLECWGCRGPALQARYDAFFDLLEKKGFDTDAIRTRLQSFAGLKIPEQQRIRHEVPHGQNH
ncbi:hypothetical protein D6783_00580 [Candidatus Woesearchaeota archaeon]|nr:MAG: hypothetical protein D6783_00580 [Candidatus Woesearchaeota archaeon]